MSDQLKLQELILRLTVYAKDLEKENKSSKTILDAIAHLTSLIK